jgi:hypothetical protein
VGAPVAADLADAVPGEDLDPNGCLDRILSWQPDKDGPDIANLLRRTPTPALRKHIGQFGVLIKPARASEYFGIAHQNDKLASLFRTTRWAGAWPSALLQLPGAMRPDRRPGGGGGASWIGGRVTRYVLIPLELVPPPN